MTNQGGQEPAKKENKNMTNKQADRILEGRAKGGDAGAMFTLLALRNREGKHYDSTVGKWGAWVPNEAR